MFPTNHRPDRPAPWWSMPGCYSYLVASLPDWHRSHSRGTETKLNRVGCSGRRPSSPDTNSTAGRVRVRKEGLFLRKYQHFPMSVYVLKRAINEEGEHQHEGACLEELAGEHRFEKFGVGARQFSGWSRPPCGGRRGSWHVTMPRRPSHWGTSTAPRPLLLPQRQKGHLRTTHHVEL